MEGFWSYNRFKKDIRDLKQIYDFTYHLYLQEHEKITEQLSRHKASNSNKKFIFINTSVGAITHSLNSLFYYTRENYPNKLRQLVLINLITSLEVYFSNLIREISARDLTPFKFEEKADYFRNHLLNFATIKTIEEDLITKDIRKLTSGGLEESLKYFQRRFEIDFKNIGIDFNEMVEIHDRRHLFVHRNGLCDATYSKSHPQFGLKPGDLIILTHEYIMTSLDKILEFVSKINEKAISKYPENRRKIYSEKGTKTFLEGEIKILVELEAKNDFNLDIDILNMPVDLTSNQLKFYLLQVIVFEKRIQFYISAMPDILKKIMKVFKQNENSIVLNTTEIDF